MNERGLIVKQFIIGDHLQFSDKDVSDIFVPFLMNGIQKKQAVKEI